MREQQDPPAESIPCPDAAADPRQGQATRHQDRAHSFTLDPRSPFRVGREAQRAQRRLRPLGDQPTGARRLGELECPLDSCRNPVSLVACAVRASRRSTALPRAWMSPSVLHRFAPVLARLVRISSIKSAIWILTSPGSWPGETMRVRRRGVRAALDHGSRPRARDPAHPGPQTQHQSEWQRNIEQSGPSIVGAAVATR